MLKIKSNRKTAFTLAETLITVVILGILAAILVPNLIKNQVENANRTKVKKAMAAYEKAINYMIIENDIKSTEALRELGQNNCQYTREYFKTIQDGSNNCIFKTADRVWWDITDITNPILILNDSQLEKSETELQTLAKDLSDKTVFALIGRFDDLGTLRVNDNAYEQGLENNTLNQKYMKKLWYFATLNDSLLTGIFDNCDVNRQKTCTININGTNINYTKVITKTDTTVDKDYNNEELCILLSRQNTYKTCGYISTAAAGNYWISDSLGVPTKAEATSNENCELSIYTECSKYGDYYEAAKTKCLQSGGHLANLAELKLAKQNGKLPSGSFWSAEERYASAYHRAYFMNNNGEAQAGGKTGNTHQIICINND